MLLLDFISTQFFGSRPSKVKKDDVVKLVKAINSVIDTFKKLADDIESGRTKQVAKIPLRADDTFN
jgi:hypothetical protein